MENTKYAAIAVLADSRGRVMTSPDAIAAGVEQAVADSRNAEAIPTLVNLDQAKKAEDAPPVIKALAGVTKQPGALDALIAAANTVAGADKPLAKPEDLKEIPVNPETTAIAQRLVEGAMSDKDWRDLGLAAADLIAYEAWWSGMLYRHESWEDYVLPEWDAASAGITADAYAWLAARHPAWKETTNFDKRVGQCVAAFKAAGGRPMCFYNPWLSQKKAAGENPSYNKPIPQFAGFAKVVATIWVETYGAPNYGGSGGFFSWLNENKEEVGDFLLWLGSAFAQAMASE